jgi:hypothetical protein
MTNNPWLSLRRDNQPYIADVDSESLAKYSMSKRALKSEFRLNTAVVPEPWCGAVLESRVMVLSGNPHWDERDDSLPMLAHNEMWANLSGKHPLFWLKPELEGTSGGNWYRDRLLKDVLKECDASSVAEGLSLIDFMGYRSHQWDHQLRVPSQQYTVQVVQRAISIGAVIIVSRGLRLWSELVPELTGYGRMFLNSSPQNVRLSAKNTSQKGFETIVSLLS